MKFRNMLNGKIHRATVTHSDLHYIGSITIDLELMKVANIVPFEFVQVVNVTNGNRFETYAIEGDSNSGVIQVNGAAAHLVNVGDLVIIMSYLQVAEPVSKDWKPSIVLVNMSNGIDRII